MYEKLPLSINKRTIWRFINLKIKRSIHHYHVFSIISILFEEIIQDLKKGKDIKIFNFGTLSFKETKPRRYFDVRYQKIMLSKSHRIMKFSLTKKIKKRICELLDIEKTFGDK